MIRARKTEENTSLEDGIYLIGISVYGNDGRFIEQHIGEADIIDYEYINNPIDEYIKQILIDGKLSDEWYRIYKLDFITKIGNLHKDRNEG